MKIVLILGCALGVDSPRETLFSPEIGYALTADYIPENMALNLPHYF